MHARSFLEIARLVEHKQAAAAAELALEAQPLAEGWLAFGGRGSYVNKACGFGLGRPISEPELDEIVTFFSSRGVEPRIELSPFVPAALLEGLDRRGFVLQRFGNVLARELSPDTPLRAGLPFGWPQGVTVERVDPRDTAAVHEYVEVSESGFLAEGELLPKEFLEIGIKAVQRPVQDAFVARIGREVVGAGGCESSGGVTALFGTSVKPAWRGRGIQQALIVARLERGLERGSQLAVIISGPGIPTERNAARLGFSMAYSRVSLVKHGAGLTPSP
ncbi:GNAT family N-acetyltransferase [Hyalangium versicolor]|uniref:GNAT family N-acetyltransferase n=1 Tax=Hyalangium versicolor TaxID=2861190 RepID=UPI001CCF7BF6|nr:GNAT family N-acetyltransferase [Hyalangium versicolor]